MENIIHLSQNHAKSMTDAKAFAKVYDKYNNDGRFSEIVDGHRAYYHELMDQVLAR